MGLAAMVLGGCADDVDSAANVNRCLEDDDACACTDGEKKCGSGGNVMICENSSWTAAQTCYDGCRDGVCTTTAASCKEGEKKCNIRQNVAVCQNGVWHESAVCQNGCKSGACTKNAASCVNGTRKCDDDGNALQCQSGVWNIQACKGICRDGVCSPYTGNSCKNPYRLSPGNTIEGNSLSGAHYQWGADPKACANIQSMLGVVALDIPESAYYNVTVSSGHSGWGVLESASCDGDGDGELALYQKTCTADGIPEPSYQYVRLLNKGTHYFFIGEQGSADQNSGVDFKASLEKTDPASNRCGYAGKIEILDTSVPHHELSGKTSDGASSAKGADDSVQCNIGSSGNEIAYAFQVSQPVVVSASMVIFRENGDPCVNPADPNDSSCPSRAALYIQSCSPAFGYALGTRKGQLTCARVSPNSPNGSSTSASPVTLEPGEYFLFVDSDETSIFYAYTLTVDFDPV